MNAKRRGRPPGQAARNRQETGEAPQPVKDTTDTEIKEENTQSIVDEAVANADPETGKDDPEQRRIVKKHRQCPHCYNGEKNGVGKQYSNHGDRAYYRCDRCRFTWAVRTSRVVED